jgi:Septum formation
MHQRPPPVRGELGSILSSLRDSGALPGAAMGSELPNQPDEPADRPPAPQLPPPPLPQQAAADWTPQDWRPPPRAPTPSEVAAGTDPEQIPSDGSAPQAKPPLDTVSLIALIAAIPSLGLVSIPLGIWGVIRTRSKQRRGRILAVISFVLIGVWAIVGTVVGVIVALPATVKTAAPAPSGMVAPTTVPATVSPTPVAPSKTKIPGRQSRGPLRKAKRVYWDQLKTGDCFKGWTEKGTYTVTRVDCRSPHEEEVTGTFNLPGGRYPGDAAVEEASDARCEKYFARYVGIDWDSSAYDYNYATPDSSSWRLGDRLVICMAEDPDHLENSRISLRNVKE